MSTKSQNKNLLFNETEFLEGELAKLTEGMTLQQQKQSIRDIFAKAMQQTNQYLSKLAKKPSRRKNKLAKVETSAYVILYKQIEEDEIVRGSKIRDPQGRLYKQISSHQYLIPGDLTAWVGRTYDMKHGGSLQQWNRLLSLLQKSEEFNIYWGIITQSIDVHVIVIASPVLIRPENNVHAPLDEKLHADIITKATFNKFITYEINRAAQNFGELFKIEISPYILENYRANSCFINLILDTFGPAMNKKKPDGKRMYKQLTYESLCELVNLECKTQDLGLSIRGSVPFFQKYKLGLDTINVFGEILFSYRPERLTGNINPQVLRILIHNNHCYRLDGHLESKFAVLKNNKKMNWEEFNDVFVTSKFQFRNINPETKAAIHFIENLDQIAETMKTTTATKIKFITNSNLVIFLFGMLDQNYIPNIQFEGNRIISLAFTFAGVFATIENSDITCPDDSTIEIHDVDTYNLYHNADDIFYEKILNRSYISEYPEDVLAVEEQYRMKPMSGYLTKEFPTGVYNSIDIKRAYTDCLKNIHEIPVFGYFDRYKKYDGHEIEDLTLYLVDFETCDNNGTILFPTRFSRSYGFKLKKSEGCTIHYFRRPSKIVKVDYQEAVDELYKFDIESGYKKYIVNKTTGLLEKWENKSKVSKLFMSRSEAQFYQLKYGGKIHAISQSITKCEDEDQEIINHSPDDKIIFLLVVEKKQKLLEGFRAIKEIIYDMMCIKIQELYDYLEENKVNMIGIKTDSILISCSKENIDEYIEFKDEIGGYRFEQDKKCVDVKIKQESNTLIYIPEVKINSLEIVDEYCREEFKNIFDKHNLILLLGVYPGVGKTTAIKNYGIKTLFITPFNKLGQELRVEKYDAMTLNSLLGINIDGKEYATTSKVDISGYSVICFDEVMLYGPNELKKIARFIAKHPEVKFFATGDLDQLSPINVPSNVANVKEYMRDCINTVFPNQITLKINKRLQTEKDRKILMNLKSEIFDRKKDVTQTFQKYGFKMITSMKQLETQHNICYFQFRSNIVNRWVQKSLKKPESIVEIDGIAYYPGLELVCKKHYKSKNLRLFVNYTYVIKKIETKGKASHTFTIVDESNGTVQILAGLIVKEHFKLPYAATCHSVQGLSINHPITIFDTNVHDRNYIWTALTRATDLKNVNIFVHPNSSEDTLSKVKTKHYFQFKIEGYKTQDRKAGRIWNDNEYIDIDWIYKELNKSETFMCPFCRIPYERYFDDNNRVITNITVDRDDNSKAHVKDNCRMCCKQCNVTKK